MSDTDILANATYGGPLRIYLRSHFDDLTILPERPFIVLYELRPMSGHWILVHDVVRTSARNSYRQMGLRRGYAIEFYDSYGLVPDSERSYISPLFPELHDKRANLLRLLYKEARGRVVFNDVAVQNPTSSTCGRHCLMRLYCANLDIDNYNAMLAHKSTVWGLTPDEIALRITPA